MQLAVLSYPKHYHITQLAVRHALKYIPDITTIFIVWDDTHDFIPEIPLNTLLNRTLNLSQCPIIKWSSIIPAIQSKKIVTGNVGQQIIKMHLDLAIKGDFIILDGDTIFNSPVDPVNVMYSNRLPYFHPRYNLVNHALGIPNYEFFSNTFMFVKGNWLTDLRNHIWEATGKHFMDLFEYDGRFNPIYEWELIAHYILDILKLPKRIEYFDKAFLTTHNFEKHFTLEKNIVLNGPDDFSPNFMKNQGITVDRTLMMQLNYTNA